MPAACAASTWKAIPRARTSAPIAAIGCSTPISLFAAMTLTSTVSARIAASTAAGSTSPPASTPSLVTSIAPSASSAAQTSSTAVCSVAIVTTWRPRGWSARTAPAIARLLDSVAPLVKTMSRGRAPISDAT